MKLRIALDFDNVIANTSQRVLDLYNFYYNKTVRFEDLTEYDLHKTLNISPEQVWQLFIEAWKDLDKLKPIDRIQTMTLINHYSNVHDLTIVSACGRPIIQKWLSHHKLRETKIKIVYSNPGDPKLLDDYDILIDDNPEHIQSMLDLNRYGFLFNRPWNERARFTYNRDTLYYRTIDAKDVMNKIDMIERVNNIVN